MITLIQRVKKASVSINRSLTGSIGKGLLLYVGFEEGDDIEKIQWTINKIINLRTFSDSDDKMNLSLKDISGEIMVIPNFTLSADLNESGRRPSFSKAAKPDIAENLYNQLLAEYKKHNVKVASGEFGAMMDIDSVCDGPVNYILRR